MRLVYIHLIVFIVVAASLLLYGFKVLIDKRKKPEDKNNIIAYLALVVGTLSLIYSIIITFSSDEYKELTNKESLVDSGDYLEIDDELCDGDFIFLGSYEQDNNLENGKEAVEWIVLRKNNDKALLISRYGLDAQPFDENQKFIDWQSCSLRDWMNSSFFDAMFEDSEKRFIQKAGTDAGTAAGDNLFLLSAEDVMRYFPLSENRKVKPTPYCIAMGARTGKDDCCWWWLRSPGVGGDHVAHVYFNGSLDSDALPNYADGAVRPALWINIREKNSL